MTPEGSFEPMVMFFGLTNSLATFQAIMNKLLQNLINTGKVAAFIDDIIVRMGIEEGHDEMVAKVIRRLEENDLYVKPEKCKWKIWEVEFLGVVIGLNEIKIEKEKVKRVSIGVANTKVCQRCSEVLEVGKLLLLIYTRLCIYC